MNQTGGGCVILLCSSSGVDVKVDVKVDVNADVNMKEGKKSGGEGLLARTV